MIENRQLQNERAEEKNPEFIWIKEVGTGALFWATLLGLILFCLRL
jgi:hypothetical protein